MTAVLRHIQSCIRKISNTNSIVAGEYYSVSARGNTYYSQNHGIQYIDMSGYMRAD